LHSVQAKVMISCGISRYLSITRPAVAQARAGGAI
jgi:hypothetical protein